MTDQARQRSAKKEKNQNRNLVVRWNCLLYQRRVTSERCAFTSHKPRLIPFSVTPREQKEPVFGCMRLIKYRIRILPVRSGRRKRVLTWLDARFSCVSTQGSRKYNQKNKFLLFDCFSFFLPTALALPLPFCRFADVGTSRGYSPLQPSPGSTGPWTRFSCATLSNHCIPRFGTAFMLPLMRLSSSG